MQMKKTRATKTVTTAPVLRSKMQRAAERRNTGITIASAALKAATNALRRHAHPYNIDANAQIAHDAGTGAMQREHTAIAEMLRAIRTGRDVDTALAMIGEFATQRRVDELRTNAERLRVSKGDDLYALEWADEQEAIATLYAAILSERRAETKAKGR